MSILLFILVVLIILALALYAVQLVPLPGPGFIKQLIMVIFVVVAIFLIAQRAGIAS